MYIQILWNCPVVIAAIAFTAGIAIQYYFSITPIVFSKCVQFLNNHCLVNNLCAHNAHFITLKGINIFLWLLLCAVCALLFASATKISRKNSILIKTLVVFFCFVCAGAIRLINFEAIGGGDISNFADTKPKFVHIRAKITSVPVIIDPNQWLMAEFSRAEPYTSFYALVQQIKTSDGWAKAGGKVKFYISEPAKKLNAGNVFESFCKIKLFSPAGNPGQFDVKKMMNRNGIFVSASVKSVGSIKIFESEKTKLFSVLRTKLRTLAQFGLSSDMTSPDSSGLLDALLLGKRGKIKQDTYNAFKNTGLLHFISLSGLHVGIFIGAVWWLGKKLSMLRPARAVLCILALAVFVMIVPPRTPTLRAAIMCLIFCISQIFGRRANMFNSLAVAAIIISLIWPMDIFNAGFALSFSAVIGILLFAEPIKKWLIQPTEKINNWFLCEPLRAAISIFAIGLAAWIAIAPLIAYYFYQINPFGFIWTVLAFPFVVVILIAGFLKIILAFLLPSAAFILGIGLETVTEWFILIVKFFAEVPLSHIVIGRVSAAFIPIYYFFLLLWRLPIISTGKIKHILCTGGLAGVIALIIISNFYTEKITLKDTLKVTVLSVGHGQCIIADLPGGKRLIFDGGSLNKNDVGRRIILPYLNYTAAKEIEAVYVSHNDIDHFNGIAEVVDERKTKNVYVNKKFIRQKNTPFTAGAKFWNFLSSKNLTPQRAKDFIRYGDVTIKKLWPANDNTENLSDNDSSLVLLVEYAGRKIMICSDVGIYPQEKLMEYYHGLDIDVMILPHHGSVKTELAGFTKAFKPEIKIASCTWYQYEKIVKSKGRTAMANSFFTNRDGAITVEVAADGRIEKHKWAIQDLNL